MASKDQIIRVEGLSKRYGNVQALRDVSFSLDTGSILGLVGDNGAGKTTLLKIINGFEQADSGTIFFKGNEVAFSDPDAARKAGIAMTYEKFALVDQAPVWENFFVGREKGRSYGPLKTVHVPKMKKSVEKTLEKYGFAFGVDKHTNELSGGQRRILVVSRAIESEPDLLLLDEPFRGLSERAINQLWEIFEDFSKDGSILITSQWYDQLESGIDEVMVFRQGENMGKFDNRDVDKKAINRLIMGGEVSANE